MSDCCTSTANCTNCCAVPAVENEQERVAEYCPSCGKKGRAVDIQTVKSLLAVSLHLLQAEDYRFCSNQTCPIVYFSSDGSEQYRETELREQVYQKHPGDKDVFVCYCFRHTPNTIHTELREEGESTVVNEIKIGIKMGRCACDIRNPQGSCCLGNIMNVIKQWQDGTGI
ncbi:MAG: hypothetical protein KDD84_13130 [Caldilineaceae bacterium]|nr:hypothetical protein [Caldilineaceae bacterium]